METTPRTRGYVTRGKLCATLLAITCLYGMCRIPNWQGSDLETLEPQERIELLQSPGIEDGRRRAILTKFYADTRLSVELLVDLSKSDSPDSEDACQLMERLRQILR